MLADRDLVLLVSSFFMIARKHPSRTATARLYLETVITWCWFGVPGGVVASSGALRRSARDGRRVVFYMMTGMHAFQS